MAAVSPVDAAHAGEYRGAATQLVAAATTPTQVVTRAELQRGLGGLLGAAVPLSDAVTADGALTAGTPASSLLVRKLELDTNKLGGGISLRRSHPVRKWGRARGQACAAQAGDPAT